MLIRIYKAVQTLLLIAVVTIIAALFSVIVFLDMNPYVIVSGSMEPELPVGSLCFIDCQQKEPETGDIISYKAGDSVITHRVIEVTDEGYVTKGDANNSKDPGIVKQKQVFGTCVFSIPKAGYAVMFFRSLKGIVLTITFVICFGILGRLIENRRE